MDVYQSLVAVNPVTLIAQICNLFIQMFFVKKFFLDKIKATYEQNMKEAKAQASEIVDRAQKTATARGEEILRQANAEAAALKQKAAADIAQEKKKALNDAKDEISGVAMAIAEKVVERQLDSSDHDKLINQFIEKLG